LAAYKIAGRFLDSLFIDHVDHEYCMRLRKKGFEIYNSKQYVIKHELGFKKTKSFIFFNFTVHGHSPIRLYYMIRNGFYVSDLYPDEKDYNRLVFKTVLFEVIKSILFYDEKFKSLKAIYTGWAHYKKGKLGRYAI
jgi:rhamnosyltransferase